MSKTKTQEVNIAVMATDIQYIKGSIKKIEESLTNMDGQYVKAAEYAGHMKEHVDFEKRLRDIEIDNASFKSQIKTWGTVAIIAIGLAQFLVGKFL